MDNIFTLSATRGDPIPFAFSFLNDHDQAQDLSLLSFAMTFRDGYTGSDLFTLSTGNGLTVDTAAGIVNVDISSARSSLVEIDPFSRRGGTVPFTVIVGDLKVTVPPGIVFVLEGDTRPKVFITIEANLT